MKHTFQWDSGTALVKTTRGLVKGYEQNGLSIFKGIPYAKAKRFHAPEPVEKWDGVFDASSYGYVCPLLNNERPSGELYVPHRYWPMDEDCQNLNVWTPGLDDKKRPVLVWLHGGGYEAGSSIEHIAYDGANMASLGNAVVVSVNHRLNILGYFDLSDFGEEYLNSANAGTDDIIAALASIFPPVSVMVMILPSGSWRRWITGCWRGRISSSGPNSRKPGNTRAASPIPMPSMLAIPVQWASGRKRRRSR